MDFGPRSVKDALGAVLAHSVAVPGGRLRKGLTLEVEHLDQLAAAGKEEVIVATLAPDDVDEDSAALRLARALVPDPYAAGLRIGPAGTGRVNIFSNINGVAEVDAARIHAANAVDPMVTVATVPPWQRMAEGGMVATVKIISYAVAGGALGRVVSAAEGALAMRPVAVSSAGFIQTTLGLKTDHSGHEATQSRLAALGVDMIGPTYVPHRVSELAHALMEADQEVVLILTASATSDARDVAPAALKSAGGDLTYFGMPVDPGNLLFIGRLGKRHVIGLPGCARSPALNGADWVIERLLCGVPVTPADIAGMGVGGLLKEIPSRPQPRVPGSKTEN